MKKSVVCLKSTSQGRSPHLSPTEGLFCLLKDQMESKKYQEKLGLQLKPAEHQVFNFFFFIAQTT